MSNHSVANKMTLAQASVDNASEDLGSPLVSGPTTDVIGTLLIVLGVIVMVTAIAEGIKPWFPIKTIKRQILASLVGLLSFLIGLLFIILPRQSRKPSPPPEPLGCQYNIDSEETARLIQTACKNLLSTKPDNYEALRNLGRAQLFLWDAQGNDASEEAINEVIDNFESAFEASNPKDANSAFHLALALSIRHFEDYDNEYEVGPARAAYERAFTIYVDPNTKIQVADFTPMVETGHYLVKSCRYDDANNIYGRVLAEDPNDYGALTSRLIALGEQAKQEKVAGKKPDFSEINTLLENDSIFLKSSGALRFNLGSIEVIRDNFDEASDYYKDAHELTNSFPQALRNEAISSMIVSGVNEADLELLDEAVKEASSLSLDLKTPAINESYSQKDLKRLMLKFAGFISDHDGLSEQDPVVEIRHDKLYPGAPCK